MKHPTHRFRQRVHCALLATALLVPGWSHGQTVDQTSGTSSGQTQTSGSSSFWSALAAWFASLSGGGSGSGDTGSGSTDSTAAAAADTTTDPTASASASASSGGGSVAVNPDALAQVIAQDSGGHADQYKVYADKLATTLAGMSPAERARIFR